MAEFWEQQMMDRMLSLCFEYRQAAQETMPKDQVEDIIDYVKFLLAENEKDVLDKLKKRGQLK